MTTPRAPWRALALCACLFLLVFGVHANGGEPRRRRLVSSSQVNASIYGNVTNTTIVLGRVIVPVEEAVAAAKAGNTLTVPTPSMTKVTYLTDVVTLPPPTSTPAPTITVTPVPTINASDTHGVPGNPTDVTAVASDAQAQVSWKAPEDDGEDPILEYEVVCIVVDTNAPLPRTLQVTTSGDGQLPTSALVSNLQNGVTYAFKVRAMNVHGYSTWSAKSQPVSPLHPPDLCTSISCSGNGACFPNYNPVVEDLANASVASAAAAVAASASCVCKPGFLPPDCSRADPSIQATWEVTAWGPCSNGCGGGTRTRQVACVDVHSSKPVARSHCTDPMPAVSYICNGFACGSKLIEVSYEIEMFYDDILFSAESERAFAVAFTTEVASALQIPPSRLDVVSLRRGSIRVQLYLLPPTQAGERSLNEVVADLQAQVNDRKSILRTQGTFCRRVYASGVKMSFFIAEQHAAGEAEDISIGGLVGTIAVSVLFVAAFGYCLRKRHERIVRMKSARAHRRMLDSSEKMKPMGIRTMTT
ncbi:Aste57867_10067 [Aphanomyces stellatus]|uniref:Aste57867_10067 protein n=1 Tax=Aphanomyces stellatus TaxID=120398 RepID=A0A485KPX8_9STRA|nr:hypothetical protein As57867_010028 [Aphanomyces stellatus]VFT86943.1 Aste57867_10067 [Aphanomyces stellatus]